MRKKPTLFRTIIYTFHFFLLWQVIIRLFRKKFHFPAPPFISIFLDSPLRRKMQPVGPFIRRSGIKKGMQVLEIGCGSGAFTPYVARAVGEQGKVFALDISKEMLKKLQAKLAMNENRDINNIELVQHSAYELPFPDASLDVVYLNAVLQEIPDKDRTLKESFRVLRKRGFLSVSEFLPDPDYPLVTTTIRLGKNAGFRLDDVLGNFWNYTVRFVK